MREGPGANQGVAVAVLPEQHRETNFRIFEGFFLEKIEEKRRNSGELPSSSQEMVVISGHAGPYFYLKKQGDGDRHTLPGKGYDNTILLASASKTVKRFGGFFLLKIRDFWLYKVSKIFTLEYKKRYRAECPSREKWATALIFFLIVHYDQKLYTL